MRECFEEYRTLQEQGRSAAILQSLFERGGTRDVADQLWAYGNSNDQLRLEDFPQAWVELQERAFCANVERTTERQHVLVKLGGRRSLRFAGPAMTCVCARRAQLQAMIDNASSCGFLVQRWRKRTLFSDLSWPPDCSLSNTERMVFGSKRELRRLVFSENCNRHGMASCDCILASTLFMSFELEL